jgi:hypothetical protein
MAESSCPKCLPVPGFDYYKAREDGEVISRTTGRPLKARPGGLLNLRAGGCQYYLTKAEVVFRAFHGTLWSDESIRFLDGNPDNTRPENLEAVGVDGRASKRARRLSPSQRCTLFRRVDAGLSPTAAPEVFRVGEAEVFHAIKTRRMDE